MISTLLTTGFTADTKLDDPNTKDREKISEEYKWNLSDLYSSLEAWEKEKEAFPEKFEKIGQYKGKLGNSAETLYTALNYMEGVVKDLFKFSSYASMLSDQDARKAEPLSMDQEANQIYTKFNTASAYITPEILAIPENKLKTFMNQEPGLSKFKHYIDDIYRTKEHTLSAEEENIIAEASLMQGNSYNIYSIFSNAEMPRPEVTLENG
ncbi:MAG: hypothetical protein KFF73_16410, partial [Cyclobacteriaceae bacterium]|nr:hypothetical protein [Cyclobacteriaceae bacterium]